MIFDSNRENRFQRQFVIQKPKGWLIFDSWNNPWFPLKVREIDTSDFDLRLIRKYFHLEIGGKPNDIFLPWHYTIDIVNETPYIINTRPFNYKSLISNFEEHLSIMIIGDSNKDIYNDIYYKAIANMIINPFRFLNGFYLLNQRKDFIFKTGRNFDIDRLFVHIIS
jgi:hypothetical protein